jgi:phenylacetate-coenzyme A ligase PaaK-like adenylate-forming protein
VSTTTDSVLDTPYGVRPDPDRLVRAAMDWHFSPETGSAFWLERARSFNFDPRSDVRTFDDLALFPDVTDELRDVQVEQLIPRGFPSRSEVVAVVESGGTTGAPKRVPLLREHAQRLVAAEARILATAGLPRDRHWLALSPSGPHGALDASKRQASDYGVLVFSIDMDPRWVKRQIAAGNARVADDYAEHLIDQAAHVLRDENVALLLATPPLLTRMCRRPELVDLIRAKITHIGWGGAHMDADSRYYYRTELFPDITLIGSYGTTMGGGKCGMERPGLTPDEPCVFDALVEPYVSFRVVDPETDRVVEYGERGQLVVSHVSKSFFLPNNHERDSAVRIAPVCEQVGDAIGDVVPLAKFGSTEVIEGVY